MQCISSATLKLYHMLARPAQLPEGICQRWLYLTGQANLQVGNMIGVSPQGYLVKCKNVYLKKHWNLTKNIILTHHSTMNKYAIWISFKLVKIATWSHNIIPCLQYAKISCHAVNTANPTCLGDSFRRSTRWSSSMNDPGMDLPPRCHRLQLQWERCFSAGSSWLIPIPRGWNQHPMGIFLSHFSGSPASLSWWRRAARSTSLGALDPSRLNLRLR